MMQLKKLIFIMGVVLTAPALGQESKKTSADLPKNAIVFAQHSDAARKDYDIWQVAADGTQMASVIVRENQQSVFTISPDGQELIYPDLVNGKRDLFRCKFSGKDPVNLTNHPANDSSPIWSPDGKQLMFSSERDHRLPEIYIMDLDSRKVTRVTNNEMHDSAGSWSPNGSKIIFTRFYPGSSKEKSRGKGVIVEHDLSTGKERKLTDLTGYCGGVDYSPDGEKIAFHRSSEENCELWVMNNDGSQQRAITKTFIDEYSPDWSPDGKWLVYTAGTGYDGQGTFDLWLIRPDGTDARIVSKAANTQMSPRWRPVKQFLD